MQPERLKIDKYNIGSDRRRHPPQVGSAQRAPRVADIAVARAQKYNQPDGRKNNQRVQQLASLLFG